MSLEPGGAIGQYRIVEQLGRGGMATVYKGYHARLDRFVAIKVLPAYFAEEPGFAERFAQEAVMIARFDHPNILTVHDYGEENGVSYLVMAFVDGGTLAERVGEPMPAHEVAGIIRPIASALDYAHDRGILHRDIKPANVLLRRDGAPVLADFGIAKMTDQTRGLTRTGAVVGTPEYMAPEQAMGEPAGVAADQYALGVVAYELLTGRVPYRAETPVAVLLAHAHRELPSPRTVNPNISLSVESALTRALAKRPQDRYPNAMAFADALVKAAAPIAAAAATQDTPQHVTIDTLRGSAQPVVRQMRGYWDRFVAPSLTNIVQPPASSTAPGSPTRTQGIPSVSSPTPPPPTIAETPPPATPVSTGGPSIHTSPTVLDTTPTGTEATGAPPISIAPVEPSSSPREATPTMDTPSSAGEEVTHNHPTEFVEPRAPSSGSIKTPNLAESAETVFVSGPEVDHAQHGVDDEAAASRAAHEALLAEIHGRPAPVATPEATVRQSEPASVAATPTPVTDEHALATTTPGQTPGNVDSYVENLSASLPPAPVALIDLYVRFAPMTAIVVGGLGVVILVVFRLLSSVGASVISLFGGVVGTPAANTSFLLIALGLLVGVLTIYGGRQMQGLRSLGWWALSTALVLGVVERTLSHVWAGVLLTLVVAYVHLLAKPRYR